MKKWLVVVLVIVLVGVVTFTLVNSDYLQRTQPPTQPEPGPKPRSKLTPSTSPPAPITQLQSETQDDNNLIPQKFARPFTPTLEDLLKPTKEADSIAGASDGSLRDIAHIMRLCQRLYDPKCDNRMDIARRLRIDYVNSGHDEAIRTHAVPALIHLLKDPSALGFDHDEAASALGDFRDPRAVEPLMEAFEKDRVDEEAIYALSSIGTPEAINYVCDLLANDSSANVREEAVTALSWNKSRESTDALEIAFINDSSLRVRVFCACALVTHGQDNRFTFLEQHMKSEDLGARRAVSRCISGLPMSKKTIPLIIQLLRDEDGETSGYAWEELEKNLNDGSFTYCPGGDVERRNALADEYEQWWYKNRDYIVWAGYTRWFTIDKEAKEVGIPTELYRQEHPWPEEENKDK